MRFVLVNDRTPRPKSFCFMCCEPIGPSYLRDIKTQIRFCDHDCYNLYSQNAVLTLLQRRGHEQSAPPAR
jgi:hypothetical protein